MKKVLITKVYESHNDWLVGRVAELIGEDSKGLLFRIKESTLGESWIVKENCEVLKPLSEIVKAWEDGKVVEHWDSSVNRWQQQFGRVFCADIHYRLKPEPTAPKIVPYTWEDREYLRGLWVKHIEEGFEGQIVAMSDEMIVVYESEFCWKNFHKNFSHLDGSPLGKTL